MCVTSPIVALLHILYDIGSLERPQNSMRVLKPENLFECCKIDFLLMIIHYVLEYNLVQYKMKYIRGGIKKF